MSYKTYKNETVRKENKKYNNNDYYHENY